MITPLIAILICQGIPWPAQKSRWKAIDLPPTTRPFVEIERFEKMKFTHVQEVEQWGPGDSKPSVIQRYYYFTYKAVYDQEAELWESLFPKTKGWSFRSPVAGSLFVSQKVDHPKISEHALILGSGTTKPSPNDPKAWLHVPDAEWVYVAFSETLKKN